MLVYVLCALICATFGNQEQAAHKSSVVSCDQVKHVASQETVEIRDSYLAGQLAGVVASPSGPLIPNASVEIIDSTESCMTAVLTDEDGRFDFVKTKPGTYRLRLSKPGFNTVLATVKIIRRSKDRLKLELPMSN